MTTKRPNLDHSLNADDFKSYYWLKEELVAFCRTQQLPTTGSKGDLTARIAYFLDTGKIPAVHSTRRLSGKQTHSEPITLDSQIPANYRSDESHRAFFKSVIGAKFHFTVQFMDWMKASAGKTYREAAEMWHTLEQQKKTQPPQIAPQFEYNQFMRDYMHHNPGKSMKDAIAAWNDKKQERGSRQYLHGENSKD